MFIICCNNSNSFKDSEINMLDLLNQMIKFEVYKKKHESDAFYQFELLKKHFESLQQPKMSRKNFYKNLIKVKKKEYSQDLDYILIHDLGQKYKKNDVIFNILLLLFWQDIIFHQTIGYISFLYLIKHKPKHPISDFTRFVNEITKGLIKKKHDSYQKSLENPIKSDNYPREFLLDYAIFYITKNAENYTSYIEIFFKTMADFKIFINKQSFRKFFQFLLIIYMHLRIIFELSESIFIINFIKNNILYLGFYFKYCQKF